jgi:hypothetical protein
MKRLTTILILFFLTLTSLTFACDCESQGDFLSVAPKSKLVALVKVNSYSTFKDIYDRPTPMSMEVEIVKVYHGQEIRKTVTVWGDNGNLCRPYLSIFKTENYYVIAFEQDSKENPLEYAISNCGDFWLNADYEKKIATGPVSEKQNEVAFTELMKFFNGDKTKLLTPEDFQEIFQLALDLPAMQQYFHIETDTTRKQIIIQHFGEANHNNLTSVKKFDQQIKIMTEEEIKNQQIKYYFEVGDWVCLLNSVRLQLFYNGEGLTTSYMFKKVDDTWTILNSELWEE